MENKNKTSIKLKAILESAYLAKVHTTAFRAARQKADSVGVPEHVLIEMTAAGMESVIFDEDSPLDKDEKRMLVRAAFRILTQDIIERNLEVLKKPVDTDGEKKEHDSKEDTYVKRAD